MAPAPLIAADGESFARMGADALAREIRRAVAGTGGCALMLAGGGTPRPVYAELARGTAGPVAWDRVTIYFGDERCVPPDHEASNYRMARRALIDRLSARPAAVHRMRGEDPDPDRAAADYAALLPAHIDVMLLGVGDDGHTASLFPGSSALQEEARRVLPVRGPKPPTRRLSVTPPVIRSARSIIVLAAGAEKAGVVARVLEGGARDAETPAALARRGLWILDRGSAAGLSPALRAAAGH